MGVTIRIQLKQLLADKDMTQKQLAERTGIRPAAISSLTRGYVERLNIDHLERICDSLEIYDMNKLLKIIPDSTEKEDINSKMKTNMNIYEVDLDQ